MFSLGVNSVLFGGFDRETAMKRHAVHEPASEILVPAPAPPRAP